MSFILPELLYPITTFGMRRASLSKFLNQTGLKGDGLDSNCHSNPVGATKLFFLMFNGCMFEVRRRPDSSTKPPSSIFRRSLFKTSSAFGIVLNDDDRPRTSVLHSPVDIDAAALGAVACQDAGRTTLGCRARWAKRRREINDGGGVAGRSVGSRRIRRC